MTGDEMAEQGPDFFEDYMSGMYDTRCTVCNGLRVVEVLDRDRCDKELLRLYDKQERELADLRAMEEVERRMGC